MNVFTCLFDFATKGAVRIKFHLFNFFSHLLILGLTDNFTTKGILIAYASFIINLFCGEFLFFRLTKALKGLERLIYANQHLEDLEEEQEDKVEHVDQVVQEDKVEHSSEEEQETETSKLVQDEQETLTDKEFKDKILLDVSSEESEDEQQSTLRERICSEINF